MATVSLTAHRCDDDVTQQAAFSYFVPEGWDVAARVVWTPETLIHPVTAFLNARDEANELRFDVFPNVSFVWAPQAFAEGTQAFGLEVAHPRRAVDHLVEIALPRMRPGHENLRVLTVEDDPSPPWASTGPRRTTPGDEAVHAQVEWDYAGRRWREDVRFVVHTAAPQQMPTPRGFVPVQFWFALPALSVLAPADRWDEVGGVLTTVRDLFRVSAEWIAALEGVFARIRNDALAAQQLSFQVQQMAHRAQQQQFEAQRQLSRTLQETSDIVTSGWEARQQTYDRVFDQQHLATMGLERFDDPSVSIPVELEAGHVDVWSDGQGRYLYSDDSTFDPNVGASGSTPSWTRLRRVD